MTKKQTLICPLFKAFQNTYTECKEERCAWYRVKARSCFTTDIGWRLQSIAVKLDALNTF